MAPPRTPLPRGWQRARMLKDSFSAGITRWTRAYGGFSFLYGYLRGLVAMTMSW